MTVKQGGSLFGAALLQALGIDPSDIFGFTLRCDVNSCPVIVLERCVGFDEPPVFDEFEIVKREKR